MSRVKRITIAVLAIALTFSGLCFEKSDVLAASVTAQQWKQTAITSPTQNNLVGAGYIDVKWTNNLDNVSEYKVYIDGALKGNYKPSGTTMSCEFYTTSVSSHTTYVVAALNNGSTIQTDTRTFYVTKKGLCVNEEMGAALDASALNIGWYYNWGYKSFKDGNAKNRTFDNVEYVPMIWGSGTVKSVAFEFGQQKGYKYMLGYNEPDLQWESNMTYSSVINKWSEFKQSGFRLGSPAVSTFPTWSAKWWEPYWNQIKSNSNLGFDFIAVHSYQQSYNGVKSALQYLQAIDECWETYHKPIWITEFAVWKFSAKDASGCAKTQEFMKVVIKGLNERSYVERYSWFCPNVEETAASSASIYNYKTGAITDIGKIYAQLGNPSGYNSKSYGVNSNISVNTSPAACAASMPTTIYSVKGRKKSFKYELKAVSKAAGYQIKYSLKKNMKKSKTKTVKKLKGTIKKLKKKKKYYVRARAYKVMDGKKLYCQWSKREKVKTK